MSNVRTLGFTLAAIALIASPLFAAGGVEKEATISFAGSGGYPPFNFITEDGDVDGFDVDIAREIAKRMELTLDYKTTAWDGIIEGLRASRYDGVLGSMGITEERKKIVNFSTPYYYSGPQLIVRKNSGITGPEELDSSKTIALVTGTTFEQDAEKLGVKIRLYEDDNQTLMELINGRVDAVLTDRIVGLNAIAKLKGGDQLELAGSVLRVEEMGIALNKKDSELLDTINKLLADIRADGTMKAISAKWFDGSDITVK